MIAIIDYNAGNLKRREDKEREKTGKDKDMPIETWEQNILLKSYILFWMFCFNTLFIIFNTNRI